MFTRGISFVLCYQLCINPVAILNMVVDVSIEIFRTRPRDIKRSTQVDIQIKIQNNNIRTISNYTKKEESNK